MSASKYLHMRVPVRGAPVYLCVWPCVFICVGECLRISVDVCTWTCMFMLCAHVSVSVRMDESVCRVTVRSVSAFMRIFGHVRTHAREYWCACGRL